MSNLIYCDKMLSNTGRCSHLATYSVMTVSGKTQIEKVANRCEEHKQTPTAGSKVLSSVRLNQDEEIGKVSTFLITLIGKEIYSKYHRNKHPYIGKYLKENGAIMCKDVFRDKWVLVYYKQIIINEQR